jgi:hypothetical protein
VALCYHSVNKDTPMGGIDWTGFNQRALELLSTNNTCIDILLTQDQTLLPKMVAGIYSFGGYSVEVVYFYMFIASLITQLYVYKTFKLLTKQPDIAKKISLLWMIWPIEFVFSITFLREMPIQCFFTTSFYQFLLFLKYNRFRCAINAILLITVSVFIHSGMIAVLLVYLFVWATRSGRFRGVKISLGIFLLLLVLSSPVGVMLMHKFGSMETIEDVVNDPHQNDKANTTYLYTIPTTPEEFITQTPYRFIMFTLSPFPWQVSNLPTFLAWLLDGIFQLFFFYQILCLLFNHQFKSRFSFEIRRTVLFIFFGLNFVFCLGTADYGTAMRHRAKILPMMMIFITPLFNKKPLADTIQV